MADITRLSRLLNGVQRHVSLADNSLVMNTLKLTTDGGSTSSELTKAILDTLIGGGDASSLHNHDGRYRTQSELSATGGAALVGADSSSIANSSSATVQLVAEDLDSAISTNATNITTNSGNISTNTAEIADIRSTQGVSAGAVNLGTFTGSTISDNNTVKGALQDLETAVELRALDADVIKRDGSVAFTADQSMGNFKLTNLAAPTNASDAARLQDVNDAAAGIDSKEAVRVATTADITLSGLQTIDGITLVDGDRVLVKDQSTATENGIYDAAAGAWSRSEDFDGSPSSEVRGGALTFVTEGTANANTSFRLTGTGELTVGSAALNWIVYSRAEAIQAGDGINKAGLVLSVDASDIAGAGLAVDGSNNLEIAASAAGTGIQLSAGVLSLDFTEFDTDDVNEGTTNLYFTDARARTAAVLNTLAGSETDQAPSVAAVNAALAAQDEASEITYSNATSGLTATDVQAAIDEVEGRVDTLEANQNAAGLSEDIAAGQSYTASTLKAVRFAKGAETAGRVYEADNDASSQDNFFVVGLVNPGSSVSAGTDISVTKAGPITATAHGFTVGAPIYLGTTGDLSSTAPSANDEAVVQVGIARDANTIEVQIQVIGVN